MDNLSITIMFPCFNDRETIIPLIRNACETISNFTDDYEIIVVDDASTDGSIEILKKESDYNKDLNVIYHKYNKGYGTTILDGLAASSKEFFFYTDGDGQYDVKEIANLLKYLDDQTILVNGYKKKRSDPWYRILIGNVYNLLMRIIFNIRLKDIDCDFRIIKNNAIDPNVFFSTSGTVCVEMVKRLEKTEGLIREAPVNHYYREYGSSQFFNIRRLVRVFFHLIRVYYILIIK